MIVNRNQGCSSPEVFCKKDVLKNFTKCTEKHLCQGFFFNKDGLRGLFLLVKSYEVCKAVLSFRLSCYRHLESEF